MPTTVENPFDTQPAKPVNGIVGGVINSAANTSPAADASSQFNPTANMQAQSYAPQTREVNAATDTTQGQLSSILATDSPLMQRARTLATQQMANRGLVNSSMNGEAGVAAMIDRATPIAGADASVYDARSKANMDATNSAGMFNVGQNNQLVGQGLSIASQMAGQKDQQQFSGEQAGRDREQQTKLQETQQQFTAVQAQLDREQQTAITELQAKFNESTASREFAANTASSTLASINTILSDPKLKPDAKRAAINNIIAAANSTMQWAGTFYNTELPPVQAPG